MINIICIFLITITAISSIFYTLRHLCRTCTFLAFHCFHSIHAIKLLSLLFEFVFFFLFSVFGSLNCCCCCCFYVCIYTFGWLYDVLLWWYKLESLVCRVYFGIFFFYFDTSIWLKFTKFSWFYVYMKFLAMILAFSTIRLDTGPHLLLH